MVTFLQTVGCAIAVYWYNKPEVYTNQWALLLLPVVIYVLYSFLDGTENTSKGNIWPAFQKSTLHKWIIGRNGYFKGEVVYDNKAALQNTRQCIFGAFPHGVVSLHHMLLMTDADGFVSEFPTLSCEKRRDLAASVVFKIPGWRELLLWMGCVDACRKNAMSVLRKGCSLYILPGGELEQILTRRGEHHVYLKKRKGFCKLALEHGVALVPVYSFGETDMFSTYSILFNLRWYASQCNPVVLALSLPVRASLFSNALRYGHMYCTRGTSEDGQVRHLQLPVQRSGVSVAVQPGIQH
mmetsp:Transcript_5762/g.11773  ORF Transcript_5762/g.11773 Transcript_5762/m.11773 type:complete len:296 (-) Transcript_5762:652-1539(-)